MRLRSEVPVAGTLVLVLPLLFAACGGHPVAATATNVPGTWTTYRSPRYHFAIAYDPRLYRASTKVVAGQLILYLDRRHTHGTIKIAAVPQDDPPGKRFVRQTLAAWGKGKLDTKSALGQSNSWSEYVAGADSATWTALNGVRGVRMNAHTVKERGVSYVLMHGDSIYSVTAAAPTAAWPAVSSQLEAVARTFRVTP